MIDRRKLLALAAAAPAAAALPRFANAAALPDLSRLRTRNVGPIEVVYKTPHGHPNGMDLRPEGMWVIDQSADNWCSLINPADGKLIREFKAEGVRQASGICVDDEGVMWIGSTYNRLIISCNANDGKLIAKYQTPGAGLIYRVKGDPVGHRTPLQPAYPEPPAPPPPPRPAPMPPGQVRPELAEAPPGTGAHCILAKGPLLYVAVPPARAIFVIDKRTWDVIDEWQTAGNRPHDMSWADAARTKIWASDSNLNAFFLHDVATGQMSERLQLPSDSPVIHGAKIYNGYMYCCDDVGWMFRFRMPA